MAENTPTGTAAATPVQDTAPKETAAEKAPPATPPGKEAEAKAPPDGDKVVSIEQAQERRGRKGPDKPEQTVPADKAPEAKQPTMEELEAADIAEDIAKRDAEAEKQAAKQKGRTPAKKPPAQRKAPAKMTPAPKKTAPTKGKTAPTKGKAAQVKAEAPAPEPPSEPKEAPRAEDPEEITYIKLDELHAFKNHPFTVRDDAEMKAMVESVKDKGVTQPAVVRPREGGGYELVSGHRRQMASQLAGYTDMPCIVRNLTDEQAITQMVEDNTNQRESILPSERAKALKMQLEAIKRQGARNGIGKENGQRSNEIVAERNKMNYKQVQRFIRLNDLTPDLLKMVDEKKIGFTSAVELSYIRPKNQRYIAVAIEGEQSAPSLSQAKRLRELDKKNMLNPDVVDGILLEEKKEVDKVILTSHELAQYFGKDKTPREMKDTIMSLLEQYKAQQKEQTMPEKKPER